MTISNVFYLDDTQGERYVVSSGESFNQEGEYFEYLIHESTWKILAGGHRPVRPISDDADIETNTHAAAQLMKAGSVVLHSEDGRFVVVRPERFFFNPAEDNG